MRQIKEQVDEFIEGLANGSVRLLTSKLFITNSIKLQNETGLSPDNVKGLYELKDTLINQFIPKYMNSKGKEKRDLANSIFQNMLWGRSIGLMYNDENASNELNWYRIQNERLNKENEKLRKDVKDLTNTVLDLTNVSKDQKVGVR